MFGHHARKFDKNPLQPQCACHTAPRLPVTCTLIEGHIAYVPLLVPYGNRYARPNDPLPLKGSTLCAQLLKDLTNMAEKLGADLPQPPSCSHTACGQKKGHSCARLSNTRRRSGETHYVCIVEKAHESCGHSANRGHGKSCILSAEGYTQVKYTVPQAVDYIPGEIARRGWEPNATGRLPLLYLLGKLKSLAKQQWLWRGITSLPQPFLPKKSLRIASRANSTFLRLLYDEVLCSFLVNSIP